MKSLGSFRRWVTPIVLLALACWIFWLRAPSLGVRMWNVDESIHAAAARTLLEGGVLYRDAIDQRTPLTYYAFAAIFGVAGVNNLFAVRVAIAAIIVATGFGVYLLGRHHRGYVAGIFAAFIYAAFANFLLFESDTFAAHTEWFVALFTTAAAVIMLRSAAPPNGKTSLLAGVLIGLAFLSKQPGATDLGAPLGSLVYLGLIGAIDRKACLQSVLALLAGFAAIIALVFGAFAAAGVGRDLLFYTWTYNVKYYGPEVSWRERILSAEPFFTSLLHHYPLLLAAIVGGLGLFAIRTAQIRYSTEELRTRRTESYLLFWCFTSLVGAMSSGRGYTHYFFQCLPPFAWLAGSTLSLTVFSRIRSTSIALRIVGGGLAILTFVSVLWTPTAARSFAAPPPDPALPVAAFVRAHSKPADKLFVWGYNPDIYLYANRAPASRFLYCTFQTGLIPWTNEGPGIDTRYAIVPGTMAQLIADLERQRPRFIIDCGVGPHRRFSKYPLQNFPDLTAFVDAHYVEIDPAVYLLRGFRVFMARDRQPSPPERPRSSRHPVPFLGGPSDRNRYVTAIVGNDPTLERLAVRCDGAEVVAVSTPPTTDLKFSFFPCGPNTAVHQLQALADWSDGTRTVGDIVSTLPVKAGISPELSNSFALPRVLGALPATGVQALLNPNAGFSNGQKIYHLHAPALLQYPLPTGITAIRGYFGFEAGAYAADNPARTDGAVFIIRLVGKDGREEILLQKWLRPQVEPADRPPQPFRIELGSITAERTLEFEITPGPDGIRSSDWTFWSDLMLEVSP